MNVNTKAPSLPPLITLTGKELTKADFTKGNDAADTLGAGKLGKVCVGRWQDMDVAIKTFSGVRSLPEHLKFEFDPYLKAHHENLLGFYGVCITPGKFCMLTEAMPMNLFAFITNYPKNDRFTNTIKMRIATGVTKALKYLHSQNIAHKYIKQTTVFLDNVNYVAKLGFYGLSQIKLKSQSSGVRSQECTVRWRAPETFTREYSKMKDIFETFKAADIYSLGMILWQLESKKTPFEGNSEWEVVQLLSVGTQPEINLRWSFAPLIRDCFAFVPSERPSAEQVLNRLRKIDLTQIYLMYLKNNVSLFKDGAMKDIFPLVARHFEVIL